MFYRGLLFADLVTSTLRVLAERMVFVFNTPNPGNKAY